MSCLQGKESVFDVLYNGLLVYLWLLFLVLGFYFINLFLSLKTTGSFPQIEQALSWLILRQNCSCLEDMLESYQQSLFLDNSLTVLLLALYQSVSGLRRFMLFTDWRSDRSRLQASHGPCSNTWHSKEFLRSTRSRAFLVFATLPFSSEVMTGSLLEIQVTVYRKAHISST